MGRLSEREGRLQKKLIPYNIAVCILSLIAALTLFFTPIITVDAGKILNDKGVIAFADKNIDAIVSSALKSGNGDVVDFKPVVKTIVTNVFESAEGEISISAAGSFRALTGGEERTKIVMDELFLGDGALVTRLIDSVVKGVANMFKSTVGRELLEGAVVNVLTDMVINNIADQTVKDALSKPENVEKIKELASILKELGDSSKVTDGDVSPVIDKFVDKVDEILGDGTTFDEETKAQVNDKIKELYDGTQEYASDVTTEALICVNLTKYVDVSALNLEQMLDGILGGDGDGGDGSEGSARKGATEGQPDGTPSDGGAEERKIINNYDGLLEEIGLGDERCEALTANLRVRLDAEADRYIREKGVDKYVDSYQYVFCVWALFIASWGILSLVSLIRVFTRDKRFTSWYVKLFCWLPPAIWLTLRFAREIISFFAPDALNGENGAAIEGVLGGITSSTWTSGLCYALLLLLSLFWAFPLKRKIKRERVAFEDDYDD